LDATLGETEFHLSELNVGRHTGKFGSATGTFTMGDGSTVTTAKANVATTSGGAATGTLNLTGGLLAADTITVGTGGDFNFTGGRLAANHFITYASDNTLLQEGGTLAPGFSRTVRSLPGITECEANYIIHTSGVLEIELFGTIAGTEYDQVQVAGTVDLDGDDQGGATLDLILQFAPSVGDTFVIVQNDGTYPVAGHFWGLPEATEFTEWYEGKEYAFWISYLGLTGEDNDVVLWTREVPPRDYVPVPGAVLLAAIGAGIVGRLRRRRSI
jgi:fibronectin-binding autotransporter adhesin